MNNAINVGGIIVCETKFENGMHCINPPET